jgi:TM2 domain-containing membrane protein YozV
MLQVANWTLAESFWRTSRVRPLRSQRSWRTDAPTFQLQREPHRMTPMIQQRMNDVDNIDMTPQQQLYFRQEYDRQVRNPSTALILTVLFGGLGAHRFYLREWGWGIAYVLFFWTYIPSIISIIECPLIRSRTTKYNERCAQQILTKMNLPRHEPEPAGDVLA